MKTVAVHPGQRSAKIFRPKSSGKPMRQILFLLHIALFLFAGIASGELEDIKVIQAREIISKIEKGEPVDYSHVTIKGDLDTSKIDLPSGTYISSSIKITDSVISGLFDLNNIILQKSTNFRGTEFLRPVSFIGTQFKGDAIFDDAHFDDHSFFIESEFNNSAQFRYTEFNGFTNFLGAKFKGEQDFHNSRFKESALFRSAVFEGDSNFEDAIFLGPATFRETQFVNAKFSGAKFNELGDFNLAQFGKSADFTGTRFSKELFFNEVKFGRLLISWDLINDRLVCDGPIYLSLIKNFKEMEQFEDADNCYYKYRDEERQDRSMGWGKFFDYISWLSCGYGVRWQHPILSAIAVALLFGMYYESYYLRRKAANFFHKQEHKNPCNYDFIQNLKKSISFSIMMLLSLPPDWFQFGREEYAKFVAHHWVSCIFERLIGWGLMLLLIGVLSRLMVRY
jgi:hypothetical protein